MTLRQRFARLPRGAFWIGGVAIALSGALAARLIAERFPLESRVPIWLAGSVVIFIGLGVLSLGARGNRDDATEERQHHDAQ